MRDEVIFFASPENVIMPIDKPNVILLTVDAFRADRTSLHGYRRPTTPTLERLAENAIVCENAF